MSDRDSVDLVSQTVRKMAVCIFGTVVVPVILSIVSIQPWMIAQIERNTVPFIVFAILAVVLGSGLALSISMPIKDKKTRDAEQSIAAKDAEIASLKRQLSETASALVALEEKGPAHTHGVTGDLLRNEAGVECIPPKVAKLVIASAEDGWRPKKIEDQRTIDLAYQRCQGLLRRQKYNNVSSGAYTGDYEVRQEWVDYLSQDPDAYRRVKEISQS